MPGGLWLFQLLTPFAFRGPSTQRLSLKRRFAAEGGGAAELHGVHSGVDLKTGDDTRSPLDPQAKAYGAQLSAVGAAPPWWHQRYHLCINMYRVLTFATIFWYVPVRSARFFGRGPNRYYYAAPVHIRAFPGGRTISIFACNSCLDFCRTGHGVQY